MLRPRVQKIKNAKFGHKQFQKKTNPQNFLKSQIKAKFLDFHKILQVLLRFLRNRLKIYYLVQHSKRPKNGQMTKKYFFFDKPFQKRPKGNHGLRVLFGPREGPIWLSVHMKNSEFIQIITLHTWFIQLIFLLKLKKNFFHFFNKAHEPCIQVSFGPGVNFTNILQAAFTRADSKSAKIHWWLDCLFTLLWTV